jgi:hypothetical protein
VRRETSRVDVLIAAVEDYRKILDSGDVNHMGAACHVVNAAFGALAELKSNREPCGPNIAILISRDGLRRFVGVEKGEVPIIQCPLSLPLSPDMDGPVFTSPLEFRSYRLHHVHSDGTREYREVPL